MQFLIPTAANGWNANAHPTYILSITKKGGGYKKAKKPAGGTPIREIVRGQWRCINLSHALHGWLRAWLTRLNYRARPAASIMHPAANTCVCMHTRAHMHPLTPSTPSRISPPASRPAQLWPLRRTGGGRQQQRSDTTFHSNGGTSKLQNMGAGLIWLLAPILYILQCGAASSTAVTVLSQVCQYVFSFDSCRHVLM